MNVVNKPEPSIGSKKAAVASLRDEPRKAPPFLRNHHHHDTGLSCFELVETMVTFSVLTCIVMIVLAVAIPMPLMIVTPGLQPLGVGCSLSSLLLLGLLLICCC